MSDEIQIHSARISKHADELTNDIVPKIQTARTTLNAINLEGGDSSITGTAVAVAYPGALQFAFETLKTEPFPHPFFGPLTKQQWNDLVLIHAGHHLSFLVPNAS